MMPAEVVALLAFAWLATTVCWTAVAADRRRQRRAAMLANQPMTLERWERQLQHAEELIDGCVRCLPDHDPEAQHMAGTLTLAAAGVAAVRDATSRRNHSR